MVSITRGTTKVAEIGSRVTLKIVPINFAVPSRCFHRLPLVSNGGLRGARGTTKAAEMGSRVTLKIVPINGAVPSRLVNVHNV
ncbi:hypothetical protein RJ640_008047 [Escallonia rubra]|uniref:Uncharacterized protein n=1 Tax=Escallonia rubra TaxID=112253 RepID=A0AA88RCY5_9ASTE|nr:hypothetical protein RJ640_008047 [Escallonia rubra]